MAKESHTQIPLIAKRVFRRKLFKPGAVQKGTVMIRSEALVPIDKWWAKNEVTMLQEIEAAVAKDHLNLPDADFRQKFLGLMSE